MKVHCVVISTRGEAFGKRVIEGDGPSVLKSLFSVMSTGEMMVREVEDFYNLHNLNGKGIEEVLAYVKAMDVDDLEELGIPCVTDQHEDFMDDMKQFLLVPGLTDLQELNENQITTIFKFED